MKFDNYLLYDVYHVTKNLCVIHGYAEKNEIIKHVLIKGKRDKRDYTEESINKVINHFETIRMIQQVRKNVYEVK
ncbi:hypothetical protein PXD04_10095 [Methanosphaera sp. ISO3-F5]|uniref:hypothetical protein n=1 Tax=Methanosphaera sp. ISO3-F5 TaxID=1452353 RepID=UPI002B26199F|nr:hypothetical protein [Methanosphaera sp. ISO3-F5]WQH64040.1 hypothetical protein PXD04_10095 [Methanosphaera sp. ISO3-F5]